MMNLKTVEIINRTPHHSRIKKRHQLMPLGIMPLEIMPLGIKTLMRISPPKIIALIAAVILILMIFLTPFPRFNLNVMI